MTRKTLYVALALFALLTSTAFSQELPQAAVSQLTNQVFGSGATARMMQNIILVTFLTLVPGVLIMATSFTRIIVALSFLRSSIGLQTTPANIILILLSLFLTFFIMSPVMQKVYDDGILPLSENRISEQQAFEKIADPFRAFMLKNVRQKELQFFLEQAAVVEGGDKLTESDFRVLVPAFMISELRRGFEIGFLIALPFLVIDIVVATITMALGMMMLPPTVISLPFKVLFFVLVDGWTLLSGSLIASFN